MSYEETHPPPAGQPQASAPPPSQPQRSGTSGWLIAFSVVTVLALGGLAAAIISKGDSGSTSATIPSVSTKTTTVQQSTTTVTTPAAPANVTIAPDVTLNSSGAPEPVKTGAQTSTAAKTTSTP